MNMRQRGQRPGENGGVIITTGLPHRLLREVVGRAHASGPTEGLTLADQGGDCVIH